jgi:fermentation-respiration switch protein FrsA (DUF1100 family)
MVSADRWPFAESRDCAVFVTRQVLEHAEPVLHVTHDREDHSWQFIGFSDGGVDTGRVIALHEAIELDPSLLQLADLPIGWRANRDTVSQPWKREAIDEA